MFMHKSFRVLPPKTSGLPRHSFQCYYKSKSDFQYDWIKAYDNLPVQICALIEIKFRKPESTTIFMFVGITCNYIDGKKGGVSPPFPMIGYNMIYLQGKGYTKYPALVADIVDEIAEPSFVVPANVRPGDFILKDVKRMLDVNFLILPMEFLLRDGYEGMDFTTQLNNTALQADKKTKNFLEATKNGKKALYNGLISSLRINGDYEHVNDEIIYHQLVHRANTTG
jgi:hypothetical protein